MGNPNSRQEQKRKRKAFAGRLFRECDGSGVLTERPKDAVKFFAHDPSVGLGLKTAMIDDMGDVKCPHCKGYNFDDVKPGKMRCCRCGESFVAEPYQ